MAVLIALHLLASVIWVGSMFFSLMILRPECIRTLEGPLRLKLMHGVMQRFFSWVWVIVLILLVTGYGMVLSTVGDLSNVGWHIKTMLFLGNFMVAVFLIAYFGPFRKVTAAISIGNNPEASKHLEKVRKLVIANLAMGVALVFAGSLGRYL